MKPSTTTFVLLILHIGAAFGHLRQQQRQLQDECAGSDPATCGCSSVNQADYRGDISVTAGGEYTCQAWDSQSPHRHSRTAENYPDKGLVSNYCRNPDNEPNGMDCLLHRVDFNIVTHSLTKYMFSHLQVPGATPLIQVRGGRIVIFQLVLILLPPPPPPRQQQLTQLPRQQLLVRQQHQLQQLQLHLQQPPPENCQHVLLRNSPIWKR